MAKKYQSRVSVFIFQPFDDESNEMIETATEAQMEEYRDRIREGVRQELLPMTDIDGEIHVAVTISEND